MHIVNVKGDTELAFLLLLLCFVDVLNFLDSLHIKSCIPLFKQRLIDCYLRELRADFYIIITCIDTSIHNHANGQFGYEIYLYNTMYL